MKKPRIPTVLAMAVLLSGCAQYMPPAFEPPALVGAGDARLHQLEPSSLGRVAIVTAAQPASIEMGVPRAPQQRMRRPLALTGGAVSAVVAAEGAFCVALPVLCPAIVAGSAWSGFSTGETVGQMVDENTDPPVPATPQEAEAGRQALLGDGAQDLQAALAAYLQSRIYWQRGVYARWADAKAADTAAPVAPDTAPDTVMEVAVQRLRGAAVWTDLPYRFTMQASLRVVRVRDGMVLFSRSYEVAASGSHYAEYLRRDADFGVVQNYLNALLAERMVDDLFVPPSPPTVAPTLVAQPAVVTGAVVATPPAVANP